MNPIHFCYWLQGYFEVSTETALTHDQMEVIKKHLRMVFYQHIDPTSPEEKQEGLSQIHNPSNSLQNISNPYDGTRC
jgi:hypothetical protein